MSIMRKLRRFFKRLKRLFNYIPVIWNGYDYDYHSAITLFTYQLERTSKFLESNRAMTLCAPDNARKIKTAVELLNKVYNEDYGVEYQDKLAELYGKDVLKFRFAPLEEKSKHSGEPLYEMKYEYEYWDNAKEIDEVHTKLFKESQKKQERAHKLVWEYISHNISGWWD
jgi:hypothetical protein